MSFTYYSASMRAIVVSWIVLLGCTKQNPAATCPNGTCSDPSHPFCDMDGVISGDPGACIAVSCTPGQFQACDGSNELVCDSSGSNYQSMSCPNGCDPSTGCTTTPIPHIEPKYLPNICDTAATVPQLEFDNSGSFDPNLDTNCSGGVVPQTGGPSICVVHAGTIAIDSGATLTVTNTPSGDGRVIALVADTDLRVDGTFDIGAKGFANGPGAILSSGFDSISPEGGGGGGASTMGGNGGSATAIGGAMNAGPASINPALLSALIGGAAANQVEDGSSGDWYYGGGGGGGGTLISCQGTVSISGTLNAGGGGGYGGSLGGGGFGGGAGGNLVLQGIGIAVSGQAFSNGGGGGGGRQANSQPGASGGDGTLSATTVAAGGFPQDGDGAGGSGGTGSSPPGDGAEPSNASAYPGGGGGSVGFLQTYTPMGVTPTLTPAHVSPPFQPNGTVPTQ